MGISKKYLREKILNEYKYIEEELRARLYGYYKRWIFKPNYDAKV